VLIPIAAAKRLTAPLWEALSRSSARCPAAIQGSVMVLRLDRAFLDRRTSTRWRPERRLGSDALVHPHESPTVRSQPDADADNEFRESIARAQFTLATVPV